MVSKVAFIPIQICLLFQIRDSFETAIFFNKTVKQRFLDAHNEFRAREDATNMRTLVWDDTLAKLALDWAKKCDGAHRPTDQRKNIGIYWYVGENIFWDTDRKDMYKPKKAVKWWYLEKQYYVFSKPGTCNKPNVDCMHYSQVVWADSCALGCAVATCDKIKNSGDKVKSGYITVCCYGPGGNVIGEKPFKKGGKKCSECKGKCSKNLCDDVCSGQP